MAQFLRDAIIRAVSQALSKYVDGVTAERAQLSIREGVLEFTSAKLKEGIVPPTLPLQLVRGEISLSLKVPWRNLGDQPVVVRVSRLTIELEPAGIPTSPEQLRLLRERWRDGRDAAVHAKAKALAAAEATDKQNAGIIARLAKNALSNLEVHVDGCCALLRDAAGELLEVRSSLQLQTTEAEGGLAIGAHDSESNRGDAGGKRKAAGMLFKSFELKDIAVHLNRTCLIGPLSLNTRISAVDSSLRLGIELVHAAFGGSLAQLPNLVGIAGRLSRTAKQRAKLFPKERRMAPVRGDSSEGESDDEAPASDVDDDGSDLDADDDDSEDGGGGSGDYELEREEKEYTELLLEKLKGRELTEQQVDRLQQIEDTAPIAWRAWHLYACEKQIQESSKERKPWLAGLFRQKDAGKDADHSDHGVMQDIKVLLKELPEDLAPETVEIVFCVPTLDLRLRDDHRNEGLEGGNVRGDLTAEARGLEVRVKGKPQGTRREWNVTGELISAYLKFADTPLVCLGSGTLATEDEEGFTDVPGAAVELTVRAHEEDDLGWVLSVNLLAPPGGEEAAAAVAAASSACSGLGIARTWPCEVHLAPWSIRRFLELYLAAMSAYGKAKPEGEGMPSQRSRAQSNARTRLNTFSPKSERPRTHTQGLMLATKSVKDVAVDAAREALPAMRFAVNVCVSAPVVHWELPSGDCASFRLGQLRACSVLRRDDAITPLAVAEPAPATDLAFVAELTQICVTIFQRQQGMKLQFRCAGKYMPGYHTAIFEQSALSACFVNEESGPRCKVSASSIRMRAGNDLWRFVGQLQPTMDWALEPVTKAGDPGMTCKRSNSGEDSPIVRRAWSRLERSATMIGRRMTKALSHRRSPTGRSHSINALMLDEIGSPTSSPSRFFILETPVGGEGFRGGAWGAAPGTLDESTAASSAEEGARAGFNQEEGTEVLGAFLGLPQPSIKPVKEEPALAPAPNYGSTPKSVSFSPADRKRTSMCSEQTAFTRNDSFAETPQSEMSTTRKSSLALSVEISGFELIVGDEEQGALLFAEQLRLQRQGPEATAELSSLMLLIKMQQQGSIPMLSLEGGGQVSTGNTGGHPWVKLQSRPITVDWRPDCAAPLLHVARGAKAAWAEAQSRVQEHLFIEEGGRGAIAESWRRWRKTRVKKIFKKIRKMRRDSTDPTKDLTALEPQEGLLVEDRLPAVAEGEELSLGIGVCLERVQLNLWPMPGSAGAPSAPCVQLDLRTLRLTLCLFKSYTVRGFAGLQGFEVQLHQRLIMAPRRVAPTSLGAPGGSVPESGRRQSVDSSAQEQKPSSPQHHQQLLEIGLLVGERTLIAANGAQLSLLFRHRDLDFILAYVHAQILDVLADFKGQPLPDEIGSSNGSDAAGQRNRETMASMVTAVGPQRTNGFSMDGESSTDTTPMGTPKPSGARMLFSLDIGCPVLFIPTFKAVTSQCMETVFDVTQGGELGPSGELEGTDDTYSMFDFGHLQLWNSAEQVDKPASIDIRFRGTVVKSTAGGRPRFVARPSTDCFTKVSILNRRVELVSTGHYCMDLMRRDVTQWLDIVAENVLYKSFAPNPPADWPTSERKVLRDKKLLEVAQRAAANAQNAGFVLQWRWDELDIDTAFTEAAPLSHIELCGGIWTLKVGGATGLDLELQARSFASLDRRTGSRNAERDFIRCGDCGRLASCSTANLETSGGYFSVPSTPAELRKGFGDGSPGTAADDQPFLYVRYAQRKAVIRIREAITVVLPQLWLDQQTWGLSCWRLCTWSSPPANRASAASMSSPPSTAQRARSENSVSKVPAEQPPPIVIQVSLQGAFRLLTAFEDPIAEHLEIRGNLFVNVTLGPVLKLDIDLVDGRFHRSKSETLICPAVKFMFKSQIESLRSETGGVLTDFRFNLVMPPTRLQLTGLDLGILTSSFGQLGRKDADPCEPREELELRDPDAFRGDRRMKMDGVFDIQGLHLLLADDRRGAQPALSVEVRCAQMQMDLRSQENRPTKWCFSCPPEALVLDVASFHAQLGVWEPVLPNWRIGLSFKQAPLEQQQAGRAALSRELEVTSDKPLTAVVSTAFLRLMSWFMPRFSAHLKSRNPDESGFESQICMVNLSGTPCTVTCGHASSEVPSGPAAISLEALCRPSGEESAAGSPQAAVGSEASLRQDSVTSANELLAALGKARQGRATVDEGQVVDVAAQGWPMLCVPLARQCLVSTQGRLVCEVLIPHPSRRLLLLSSGACIENRTEFALEVRFLDRLGNLPVDASGLEPINASMVRPDLTHHTAAAQAHMHGPSSASMTLGTLTLGSIGDEAAVDDDARCRRSSTLTPFGHGTVTIGPGQILFAPFAALHGTAKQPTLQVQLRPSGGLHAWSAAKSVGVGCTESKPLELESEGIGGAMQTFFVEVEDRGHAELTTLRLIVWTRSLANAMPCALECRFGSGSNNLVSVGPFGEIPMPAQAAEFQLRLESQGGWTDWSGWLRWQAKDETEEFTVNCRGTPVALNLMRDAIRRRAVVYAPFWFVDTTGLGAQMHVAKRQAVLFSWESNTICLLPPIIKPGPGNCQVELALEGQEAVSTAVPPLGAVELVKLPPHYEAVLRTERISATETFGVHCRLVSLLPKFVLFNRTCSSIAFWQEGCSFVEQVPAGENSMFFFEPVGRQRLVFAPLSPGQQFESAVAHSPSFELDDHTIGAYPISTQSGPMCLKISREGGVLTATVDLEGCHEVHNEHKSLIVEVRPDGDRKAAVVACPGQTKTFASPDPFEKGNSAEFFLTRLGGEARSGPLVERVKLDLRRRDRLELRVGGLPVTVLVATIKRVAVITVRPRLWQEAIVERVDMHINLKSIAFALVGEAPRRELFGVCIDGIDLRIGRDNDEDMKTWAVEVDKLQVDRLYPTPDVLLASVRPPFLKWHILREDCNSSHTLLGSGDLTVGELEAAVDDVTVQQLMLFVREAVVEPPGLHLEQVLQRTASTYSQSCREPPDLPPTFTLRSLVVSSARLRIWARLNMSNSFLPRALVWFVRVTGLGVSVLQLDGVVIEVPSLRFFQYECLFGRPDPPFMGSTWGLLSRLGKRYVPELMQCWKSVVSNSNIMFGGVLSRQFWLPKNRVVNTAHAERCRIGRRGQVETKEDGT